MIVQCDCNAATICPNGRTGSAEKCRMWMNDEKSPVVVSARIAQAIEHGLSLYKSTFQAPSETFFTIVVTGRRWFRWHSIMQNNVRNSDTNNVSDALIDHMQRAGFRKITAGIWPA